MFGNYEQFIYLCVRFHSKKKNFFFFQTHIKHIIVNTHTIPTHYLLADIATYSAGTPADHCVDPENLSAANHNMLSTLLRFIENRIDDENLKIEEMADAVGMGRTAFYGRMRMLVGAAPSEFLRKMRMKRACEFISGSTLNFTQIAFHVGFSDPKYFTKCFKKYMGQTPSEYRRTARI